ncbi:LuxR family transcriptional regulator [Rhizobium sp. L1K21]|uniref:helix-turn-helix transcriptional regulator n=1 Tax=Rhizobium sp. L1K21 TaxID=2954933 RepID=UPI0020925907|nr:LuxR family transcriptional regulator [Rhizobium sp. L1K21]MCO6188046.1 LuxR family transcriptional regulator [Rhizobium sp. L1K21]
MSKLQSSAEALLIAQNQEETFRIYCDFVEYLGYDTAVFSLLSDHDSIGLKRLHGFLTDYPEDWIKHYHQNDCHEVDPVYQLGLSKPGAFFWSDAIDELSRVPRFGGDVREDWHQLMREAEDAGVADGLTVSIFNASGEVAGFGISRKQTVGKGNIEHLAEVFLLSSVFYDKFLSFYQTAPVPHLTEREKDVLSWSASGKTDWEIAEITAISTATVRFHWNNIFQKLGVNNKTAATVMAIRRKLIIPEALRSAVVKQPQA